MELHVVPVDKPDDMNVIVGQAHFIKTVDDIHEALAGVSAALRFGIAFCEASGGRRVFDTKETWIALERRELDRAPMVRVADDDRDAERDAEDLEQLAAIERGDERGRGAGRCGGVGGGHGGSSLTARARMSRRRAGEVSAASGTGVTGVRCRGPPAAPRASLSREGRQLLAPIGPSVHRPVHRIRADGADERSHVLG